MIDSYEFYKCTLDSLTEHIVVIDATGRIQFSNQAWAEYGHKNQCALPGGWDGVNYLDVCDAAAASGEDFGRDAATGIRDVLQSRTESYVLEYPCHAPDDKRWFMMTVKPLKFRGDTMCVIAHRDITRRRVTEEALAAQSRLDGLTGIANRRTFDEFLNTEWSRCARQQQPLTLALLDIDHFKLVNDHYGHQAGDDCLIKISAVLDSQKKRPGDLCARYGGEEFAYVFGNSTSENALVVVGKLLECIRMLGIPNKSSPTAGIVTASVGLATIYPKVGENSSQLIGAADKLLYLAKSQGRDQVVLR